MIRKLSKKVLQGKEKETGSEIELNTPRVLAAEKKLIKQMSLDSMKTDQSPSRKDSTKEGALRTHALYKKKVGIQRSATIQGEADGEVNARRRKTSTKTRVSRNCGICYKEFCNPKKLPCNHVFCFNCLLQYVNPKMLLDCPRCNQEVLVDAEMTNLPDYEDIKDAHQSCSQENLQDCQLCQVNDIKLTVCQHCNKSFCEMCMETHINLLMGQREKMRSHIEETREALLTAQADFKDSLSEIAVEADEAAEMQIAAVQKKREKLDEELCDILNARNTEFNRLQENINKLTEKLSTGLEASSQEAKMTILKGMRSDYEKLTKSMDDFSSERISLVPDSLSLSCQLNDTKPSKGTSGDISVLHLVDTCHLSWSGCVQLSTVEECPWNGQVWVGDTGTGEVSVFSHEGKLTKTIRGHGIIYPVGIAFGIKDREIFIADQRQQCIWVLNGNTYEITRHFGKDSSKKHRLHSISCILMDHKERIWVLNGNRVQIWSTGGEYQRTQEDGLSSISRISNISLNKAGKRIAVLESAQNRVYVMSTISWRTLFVIDVKEKVVKLTWDLYDRIIILLKDRVQVYEGRNLSKNEKIDEAPSNLSTLGDDVAVCYNHHVAVKSWKERK